MLNSRLVTSELAGASLIIRANRGCHKWGLNFLLIWTIATDEVVMKLNDLGCKTLGYADDLTIFVV